MFVNNTFQYTASLIVNYNTSNNKYAFYCLSFHFFTKLTCHTDGIKIQTTNYIKLTIRSKSNHSIVLTFNQPTE